MQRESAKPDMLATFAMPGLRTRRVMHALSTPMNSADALPQARRRHECVRVCRFHDFFDAEQST
jgi:hypothetical protein